MRWRTFIMVIVVVLFVWHWRRHSPEQSAVQQEIQQPQPRVSETAEARELPAPENSKVPASKPQPTAAGASAPTVSEDQDPYHAEPFHFRKLKAPMPSSLKDILSKRTDFKEPQLPQINPLVKGFDGDVLTGTCDGFYQEKSGELKPIYFSRDSGGIGIGFGQGEQGSGRAQWSTVQGNLKVTNYNEDPYSLILEFGDDYIVYLKFHSSSDLPYGRLKWRYLNGYLIKGPTQGAESSRVVVVEDSLLNWDLHERDPRDPPLEWPKLFEQLAPVRWK